MKKSIIISAIAGAVIGAGSVITAGIIINLRNQKAMKEDIIDSDIDDTKCDCDDCEDIVIDEADDAETSETV